MSLKMLKILIKTMEQGHVEKVQELIAQGADINDKDSFGWTPLHEVAFKGLIDMAKLLLSKGAGINAKTVDGFTPLHAVAGTGHTDMVKFLLSKGADLNAKNKAGQTPYDVAKSKEMKKLLKPKK